MRTDEKIGYMIGCLQVVKDELDHMSEHLALEPKDYGDEQSVRKYWEYIERTGMPNKSLVKSYILSEFTDRHGAGRITAHYSEEKTNNEKDTYYELYTYTVCDNFTDAKKKKTIETLDDEIFRMLFDEQEECQEVCDRLNASLGDSVNETVSTS